MKATSVLTALSVLCPALALGATHQIASTECSSVAEPGFYSPVSRSKLSSVWTDGSSTAFFDAEATATTGAQYAFHLVSVTSAPTASEIQGIWNITKNGAPLCTNCQGKAYGLTGTYFKLYIQGESYFLGCRISSRSDS